MSYKDDNYVYKDDNQGVNHLINVSLNIVPDRFIVAPYSSIFCRELVAVSAFVRISKWENSQSLCKTVSSGEVKATDEPLCRVSSSRISASQDPQHHVRGRDRFAFRCKVPSQVASVPASNVN